MKARRHQPKDEAVHTAERVIIGHCPRCGRVLVVLNSHEVWPWIQCVCDWEGATTDFHHERYVRLIPMRGDYGGDPEAAADKPAG